MLSKFIPKEASWSLVEWMEGGVAVFVPEDAGWALHLDREVIGLVREDDVNSRLGLEVADG